MKPCIRIGATAPRNRSQMAVDVLRPYVSERNYWIVRHHGLFQDYYWMHHYGQDSNQRDRFAEHQWYRNCEDFRTRWGQTGFDPNYLTAPLSYFEPMVVELFSRPNEGESQTFLRIHETGKPLGPLRRR